MPEDRLVCFYHNDTEGLFWCIDCHEMLCSSCMTSHKNEPSTDKHKLISKDEHCKLPPHEFTTTNMCSVHDMKTEFFCKDHDVACCVICTRDEHTACTDVQSLDNFIKNFSTSTLISDLNDKLDNLIVDACNISKHVLKNQQNLEEQRKDIIRKIDSTRNSINLYLDDLEARIKDEISEMVKKTNMKLDSESKKLNEFDLSLQKMKDKLAKIAKHTNKEQIFWDCSHIKRISLDGRAYLDSISEKSLVLSDEKVHEHIRKEIRSFGRVALIENNLQYTNETKIGVSDIHLKRKTFIKIRTESNRVITGCAILDDMKMVFVDFQNSRLIIHNENGSFNKSIELPGKPSNVSVVNSNVIAVTLWLSGKLVLFDLKSDTVIRDIKTDSKCYSVFYNGSQFLLSLNDSNVLQIIDKQGKEFRRLELPTTGFAYAVQHEHQFILSSEEENKVKCCTYSGELLWSTSIPNNGKPHQLATNSKGFIFVTCFETSQLMVLSSNGAQHVILLDIEDGLMNPSAIHIKNDKVLISNSFSGDAHLYSLHIPAQ